MLKVITAVRVFVTSPSGPLTILMGIIYLFTFYEPSSCYKGRDYTEGAPIGGPTGLKSQGGVESTGGSTLPPSV